MGTISVPGAALMYVCLFVCMCMCVGAEGGAAQLSALRQLQVLVLVMW